MVTESTDEGPEDNPVLPPFGGILMMELIDKERAKVVKATESMKRAFLEAAGMCCDCGDVIAGIDAALREADEACINQAVQEYRRLWGETPTDWPRRGSRPKGGAAQ